MASSDANNIDICVLFKGQWHNDMRNGHGALTLTSGMKYEGMWVNDCPEKLAVKLTITLSAQSECQSIIPGQMFTVKVECQTQEREIVTEGIFSQSLQK